MRVITPDEMQAVDRAAVEGGIDALELMERAGRGLAEAARDMLGGASGRAVRVVAGKGKNGGDGLVAARYLAEWGAAVEIELLDAAEGLHADALANLDRLPREVGRGKRGTACDLIIDCVFGIGFHGEAGGRYGAAIDEINAAGCPVLACDIPSGVDGLTGAVRGPAVRADATITFALPKTGLYLFPGAGLTGPVQVCDIGIPLELAGRVAASDIETLEPAGMGDVIPRRPRDAHKSACGRVLVVAGSPGMTGAAALAAEASLRAGAGVCTLAVPLSLNPVMEVKLTEVMTVPVAESASGGLAAAALEGIAALLPRMDAVVLGPGIGRDDDAALLVASLLERVELPLVLDADGLNCAAREPIVLKRREAPLVITPHARELSRLTGDEVAAITADPLGAAAAAADRFGCVVLLKGAHTVIAWEGRQAVNLSGTSAMATAGSGDVLAGCIGTLLAQGVDAFGAACCGAHLHGAAGEAAAAGVGGIGMLAGDITAWLPRARASLVAAASGSNLGEE